MQDKIFKVKIFEVTHKSVKSVKVFSLEIFRLYGTIMVNFSGRNIWQTMQIKVNGEEKFGKYCSQRIICLTGCIQFSKDIMA